MAGERILIADDEQDIITILSTSLTMDGYQVEVSRNGREALEKLAAGTFDLLILDVMMPEMNGWEVCKKIKGDPLKKGIPVIILTARAQNVDELMSFESGADEYMPKPFEYPELLAAVQKLIAAKKG